MPFESGFDVLCGGEELKFGGDCGKTAEGESGKPGIVFDPGEDRFNHPSSFPVLLTPRFPSYFAAHALHQAGMLRDWALTRD